MKKVTRHLLAGAGIALIILSILMMAGVVHAAEPAETRGEYITNTRIGDLTVFDQNYSVQGITDNMFAAPYLYTYVQNYTLTYDSTKNAVKYHTWPGNTYYLFVGGLYPAVHTTYYVTIDFDADNVNANAYIYTATMWIALQKPDATSMKIIAYYYNSTGSLLTKTVTVNDWDKIAPGTITLTWNGENKTYHVGLVGNSSVSIWSPGTYVEDDLPYPVLSGTFMYIKTYFSTGTYVDVYLYGLKQTIPRYTITAVPRNNLLAFGFDGPHSYATVHNGMEYLKKNGFRATLFFDPTYEWATNSTVKKYYADLVNNHSWEVGIHYSTQLTSLSWANATAKMTAEYNAVKENFSAPQTWCSLTNADNVTHAQYAYNNLGHIQWRNGREGVKPVPNIGNIDNATWNFWDVASQHGFVYPAFTHETDKDPAIDYSIDYSKFTTWVDRAKQHGIEIVPFIDYFQINKNQIDAYFTNIERGDGFIRFTAHTNGYRAFVDVDYTPTNNTVVKDLTTGEYINWTKGSVAFWVEDGHEYEILEQPPAPAGAPEGVQWNVTPWNVLLMFVGFVMVAASARRW